MAVQYAQFKLNPSAPGGVTQASYFYGHLGDNNVDLTTLNSTLCGVYTALAYGIASYIPFDNFPLFTTAKPLSSYFFQVGGTTNVPINKPTNVNPVVMPSSYTLKAGFNFICLDPNSLSAKFVDLGLTTTNIDIIYTTADGNRPAGDEDFTAAALRYVGLASWQPGIIGNTITSFQPGSAYLIVAKQQTTLNFQRRLQYIITDSGNTAPTGPNYILTCENGDRLTTGVSG